MTVDSFSRNVMISMAGHVLVVVLIMFRAAIAPNDPIIARRAIRVDVVGLPQKMQQMPAPAAEEKPAPVAAPAPAPTPKPAQKVLPKKTEPTVNLKKKEAELKKKQAEALRNMERANDQASALSKLDAANKTKAKPGKVAGNVISHGSATEGLDENLGDEYQFAVADLVHSHFKIAQYVAEQNLQGAIRVFIDDRGYILQKTWIKHSGNSDFDNAAMQALDSSQPLPPPPAGLRRKYATTGIPLGFPK